MTLDQIPNLLLTILSISGIVSLALNKRIKDHVDPLKIKIDSMAEKQELQYDALTKLFDEKHLNNKKSIERIDREKKEDNKDIYKELKDQSGRIAILERMHTDKDLKCGS